VRFYTCGQLGHMSQDCPENVARERGTKVVQVKIEPPNTLEEYINALEEGEVLIIKKIWLKTNKDVYEQAQRRSLFRTMCKSKGKCCKLVINSGSTDNLVSVEMVEKINLKKTPHLTPYKVYWLQKGHPVLVNEQCKVEFQIGGYKDEFLCDVFPMDVCHILLGRP